jgi:hypothetical protein
MKVTEAVKKPAAALSADGTLSEGAIPSGRPVRNQRASSFVSSLME